MKRNGMENILQQKFRAHVMTIRFFLFASLFMSINEEVFFRCKLID